MAHSLIAALHCTSANCRRVQVLGELPCTLIVPVASAKRRCELSRLVGMNDAVHDPSSPRELDGTSASKGSQKTNTLSSKPCLTARVGPSILSADLSLLGSECTRLMDAGADYLHLDVMDGHFVPNITFGHPVVRCLRPKLPGVFFDMHMMVNKPECWVQGMADAGAEQYTFHVEATEDPADCARKVREAGMKCGLGVKPGTPVEALLPYIEDSLVDMALVMTVEPGFGGQKFMAEPIAKVVELRRRFPHLDIEVDGGVGPANVELCAGAGANMIVSGTAVTSSSDPEEVIANLRRMTHAKLQRAAHNQCNEGNVSKH